MADCVYLGKQLTVETIRYECQIHGVCQLQNGSRTIPSCDTCTRRLEINAPQFASQWEDCLSVVNREMRPENYSLRGLLAGRSVFLACGGPSAKELPLESLNNRGCWTMAVNNMAGNPRFRPQAFVCNDPPLKFSHSIWLDPAILKFITTPKLSTGRGTLRQKVGDSFIRLVDDQKKPILTRDCPNVWGVARRLWLKPDDSFFLNPQVSVGNYKAGSEISGEPSTICTMLMAMRVLRYLGASRVFLLGVDFYMDPGKGLYDNYSFQQSRDINACEANNAQFAVVNDWLCRLQEAKVFERFGIEFFNCNPVSRLRAFDYVPFETAYRLVTKGVEARPDLSGWYEKKDKVEEP